MDVTKPRSNIPILRAQSGEVLAGDLSSVVLTSARSNWHNLVVEEHRVPSRELDDAMFIQHVVVVNVGRPVTFEVTKAAKGKPVQLAS